MIFTPEHCELILQGKKTMTRRLARPDDFLINWPMPCVFRYMKNGKSRLWRRANAIYSINPGYGKKGVGFIGTTAIRRERLQEIPHNDIGREGIQDIWPVLMNTAYLITGARNENELRRTLFRDAFAALWDSINKKKGTRWEDNPDVWVLTFEAVK